LLGYGTAYAVEYLAEEVGLPVALDVVTNKYNKNPAGGGNLIFYPLSFLSAAKPLS
jgi:hypothetical protein